MGASLIGALAPGLLRVNAGRAPPDKLDSSV
jgi:hypothetical protein